MAVMISWMNPIDWFTAHPRSVNESYCRHLASAAGFGFALIRAGLACIVHGLFPFLFLRTGSDAVRDLHARMVVQRHRTAPPAFLDCGDGEA